MSTCPPADNTPLLVIPLHRDASVFGCARLHLGRRCFYIDFGPRCLRFDLSRCSSSPLRRRQDDCPGQAARSLQATSSRQMDRKHPRGRGPPSSRLQQPSLPHLLLQAHQPGRSRHQPRSRQRKSAFGSQPSAVTARTDSLVWISPFQRDRLQLITLSLGFDCALPPNPNPPLLDPTDEICAINTWGHVWNATAPKEHEEKVLPPEF